MPGTNTKKRETEAALKKAVQARVGSFDNLNIYKGTYSQDELRIIRRTLAKRANQRLVRLEAPTAVSKVTGESYSSYGAAEIAYKYIEDTRFAGGEAPDKLRFNENFGFTADSLWDIKKEIVVLQEFLGSVSSTVRGQKAIEKMRISTFESGQWGTGKSNRKLKFADTKEFYDFLNSDTFHALIASGFDSEVIVELYDISSEKIPQDELIENMSEALEEFRKGKLAVNKKNLQKRALKGSSNKKSKKG